MKTKFKDLLLYSLATIGVVALFISAIQTRPTPESNVVGESHIYQLSGITNTSGRPKMYKLNKVTGDVWLYEGEKPAVKIK